MPDLWFALAMGGLTFGLSMLFLGGLVIAAHWPVKAKPEPKVYGPRPTVKELLSKGVDPWGPEEHAMMYRWPGP